MKDGLMEVFFVAKKEVLNLIKDDSTFFEREPMEIIAKKIFVAFKHNDFWQSMDTLRDKKLLDELFKKIFFLE